MLSADIRPARKHHALFCSAHGFIENKSRTGNSKTGHIFRLVILLISSLILSLFSYSQGEWNNWYFGFGTAMKFTGGVPAGLAGSPFFSNPSTTASVSDSLGNFLFFSNGWQVYNRNYDVMPNGSYLHGGADLTPQNVYAVPKINDPGKYYLFTVGQPGEPWGMQYSIIDMSLDGGLGDIISTQKNILLSQGDSLIEVLTGVRHANNRDIWIVGKGGTDRSYYAYLITAAGISGSPVISPSMIKGDYHDGWGDLKISQDGKSLVFSDTLTEICNFNAQTGVVTPKFRIKLNAVNALGAEFSVDAKYLYLSSSYCNPQHPEWDVGYQFDMSFKDSLSFFQHGVYLGYPFGNHMQLGPDSKIYCPSCEIPDSMNCINHPSLPGLSCNWQKDILCLLGIQNEGTTPQFLQTYKAYAHFTGNCYSDSTLFSADIWPPPDSIHWDFGDPPSGSSNFSLLPSPKHVYSNPGSYPVILFVRHLDNRTDTSWITVTILPSHQPVLGPDQTICNGDSVTFDAGACAGCSYEWKLSGTGTTLSTSETYKTGTDGIYVVTVEVNGNCPKSDTVQLTTTAVPVLTNNPLNKTICTGESTNISLTSAPSGAMFHWTATLTSGNVTGYSADSGLVINQVLHNSLATPGSVTYHITPKIGSCSGSTVDFPVTINPGDSVKVSISASGNSVCSGNSVTFTAIPTYGGSSPSYQWKVNGVNSGTNNAVFTFAPANGDVVLCILTSSNTVCTINNPATSNTITMVVNPLLPVSVNIAPSVNPCCAGNSVTFTATPTNGGSSPSYQWKVNGGNVGTNSPGYSYIPINGDIVKCVLTSNVQCPSGNPATSNSITMTVNPNLTVSISITASANPFCSGSSVTFTATPTNGGTSPQYQWKVNGGNVGTNSPTYNYNPVNGDQVTCTLTSNLPCTQNNPATSNTVNMIVNNSIPAGISITANPNPFCPGTTVNYTATPVNGGTTPVYQWKVNGTNQGTNSPNYSYAPQAGDSIRCIITSNLPCVSNNPASSNRIVMTALPVPPVTFTLCFDSVTTIAAAPFILKGGIPLGGTYSGPGVNSGTGVFTPSVAGVGTKTITYSYTNVSLCTALMAKNIIVQAAPVFTCGNNLQDIRDNKIYPTVQIGSQCWMRKNLNYGTAIQGTTEQTDNCVNEKYCYNDDQTQCGIYGGLYQWDELMAYNNTPGSQGLCPPGWHVPTQAEWMTLFNANLTQGLAGKPLQDSIINGFRAIESGIIYSNMTWKFKGFATFFWSSNSYDAIKALSHSMNLQNFGVSDYYSNRSNAFAARCLKD